MLENRLMNSSDHRFTVTEPTRIPFEAVVLGYGPMLLILAGGAATWLLNGPTAEVAARLTFTFAAAILLFLSGVRRGLSFRSPEGPTLSQIATFMWLFFLGLGAVLLGPSWIATMLVILGYGSVAVLDAMAARREDAPPYFARLRPTQMPIGILGLVVLLLHFAR